MSAKFELKKSKNDKFFFNLLAPNGEVILTSQMYASKRTAKKGIDSVQANAPEKSQYQEHENKTGKHYFVLRALNSQVIGTGQGYANRGAMTKGINSVIKNAGKAQIVDMSTVSVTSK